MTNWIITLGYGKIDNDKIIYIPKKIEPEGSKPFYAYTIVNSNIQFENGIIKFSVTAKDKYAICQAVLETDKGELFIGMNTNGLLFGITKQDSENKRFETAIGGGYAETYDVEKTYNYEIHVNGSIIILFVNGVKITETTQEIRSSQIKFFMSSEQEIVISKIEVAAKKPKVFIVMQFSEEFNQLYTEVIKPICEEFGFECERADEFYTSTPIIADIIRSLRESSIIIAEITPDNPNVFYELGYAHAINKPTILLCERKKREKLPFDISSFRTLFYEDSILGKSTIEKNLKKFLENIKL